MRDICFKYVATSSIQIFYWNMQELAFTLLDKCILGVVVMQNKFGFYANFTMWEQNFGH